MHLGFRRQGNLGVLIQNLGPGGAFVEVVGKLGQEAATGEVQ